MTLAKPPISIVPPLENRHFPKETLRERLTRTEFEQRYQAMPHIRKAELIEGVTYIASPVRIRSHGEPHGNLVGWLWTYKAATPGVILGIEPTKNLTSSSTTTSNTEWVEIQEVMTDVRYSTQFKAAKTADNHSGRTL